MKAPMKPVISTVPASPPLKPYWTENTWVIAPMRRNTTPQVKLYQMLYISMRSLRPREGTSVTHPMYNESAMTMAKRWEEARSAVAPELIIRELGVSRSVKRYVSGRVHEILSASTQPSKCSPPST